MRRVENQPYGGQSNAEDKHSRKILLLIDQAVSLGFSPQGAEQIVSIVYDTKGKDFEDTEEALNELHSQLNQLASQLTNVGIRNPFLALEKAFLSCKNIDSVKKAVTELMSLPMTILRESAEQFDPAKGIEGFISVIKALPGYELHAKDEAIKLLKEMVAAQSQRSEQLTQQVEQLSQQVVHLLAVNAAAPARGHSMGMSDDRPRVRLGGFTTDQEAADRREFIQALCCLLPIFAIDVVEEAAKLGAQAFVGAACVVAGLCCCDRHGLKSPSWDGCDERHNIAQKCGVKPASTCCNVAQNCTSSFYQDGCLVSLAKPFVAVGRAVSSVFGR